MTVGPGTVVITATELNRIKQHLIRDEIPKDHVKRLELQKISQNRASKWTNTLAGSRRMKSQARLKALEEEEKKRQEIDVKEADYQLECRKSVINAANAKIAQDNDRVKSFNSQMMYCDVIAERESQAELKRELEKLEGFRDERYREMDRQNYRRMLERELKEQTQAEERIKDIATSQATQREQNRQKAREEDEQRLREQALIRLKAAEDLAAELKTNEKRRQILEANHAATRKIQEYNKGIKAQEEARYQKEDKRIAEYAQEKQRMIDLRKAKEQQITKLKLDAQQRMIDRQTERLAQIASQQTNLLQSQVENLEKETLQKIAEKEEMKRLMEIDCHKSRCEQIEAKKKVRMIEMAEDAEIAQFWKEHAEHFQEEKWIEDMLRKRELKDLQRDHIIAAELRRRKEREMQRKKDKVTAAAKLKLDEEDQVFQIYATNVIHEYVDEGKNVIPIVRNLKEFHAKANQIG